ncbi:MAG: ABC transporter substrate-binding protein [Alphaproteobacteria bacterium]
MRALVFAAAMAASLIAITGPGATSAAAGPAQELIQKLADEAEPVLNDDALDAKTRAAKVVQLLTGVLDRQLMAQTILGRHWRRATPEQQAELADLLESYLIESYASRVDSFDGVVDFAVDGETALGDRTLVQTRILRPNQPAVAVSWQVETVGGAQVVTDILVEGVSLIISQQADFASVIRNQGGLEGLIDLLRKRVTTN